MGFLFRMFVSFSYLIAGYIWLIISSAVIQVLGPSTQQWNIAKTLMRLLFKLWPYHLFSAGLLILAFDVEEAYYSPFYHAFFYIFLFFFMYVLPFIAFFRSTAAAMREGGPVNVEGSPFMNMNAQMFNMSQQETPLEALAAEQQGPRRRGVVIEEVDEDE